MFAAVQWRKLLLEFVSVVLIRNCDQLAEDTDRAGHNSESRRQVQDRTDHKLLLLGYRQSQQVNYVKIYTHHQAHMGWAALGVKLCKWMSGRKPDGQWISNLYTAQVIDEGFRKCHHSRLDKWLVSPRLCAEYSVCVVSNILQRYHSFLLQIS